MKDRRNPSRLFCCINVYELLPEVFDLIIKTEGGKKRRKKNREKKNKAEITTNVTSLQANRRFALYSGSRDNAKSGISQ